MTIRKIGVEEEMQLVDPTTGRPQPASARAVAVDQQSSVAADGTVEQELFLHQLETSTRPCLSLDDLDDSLRAARRRAACDAEAAGSLMVAVPTPVLEGEVGEVTRRPRYERIVHDFGLIGREAGVAGMHVHIDVSDDDEAVAVLDRIRPWLPVLLAASANSPYWLGTDSGYASWRTQLWRRWPSAGASDVYVDAAGYRAATQAILDSGAAYDPGMLYLDARLATDLPTVEIRVADVCTDVELVCLVAGLTRALVETAARDYRAGEPVPVWRSDLLRVAYWKASRFGVGYELLHPIDQGPAPARRVIEALLDHARDALTEAGDLDRVRDLVEWLLARGSGASQQRAVVEAGGDLHTVVDDLVQRTRLSYESR